LAWPAPATRGQAESRASGSSYRTRHRNPMSGRYAVLQYCPPGAKRASESDATNPEKRPAMKRRQATRGHTPVALRRGRLRALWPVDRDRHRGRASALNGPLNSGRRSGGCAARGSRIRRSVSVSGSRPEAFTGSAQSRAFDNPPRFYYGLIPLTRGAFNKRPVAERVDPECKCKFDPYGLALLAFSSDERC